jgi:7,8-dihydroneopterin aldolase/epimerase/oxygenase
MDASPMDALQINGIRAYGYTGFFPEEQTLGQWFEVDLVVWWDISKAGESDRLEEAYDYRNSVKAIQELIRTARFKLIEKLVEAIAQIVLASGAEKVQVRLTKVSPPIPDFSGSVAIEIVRAAKSSSEPLSPKK